MLGKTLNVVLAAAVSVVLVAAVSVVIVTTFLISCGLIFLLIACDVLASTREKAEKVRDFVLKAVAWRWHKRCSVSNVLVEVLMAEKDIPVNSTAIQAARYDKAAGTLTLTFLPNGRSYAFPASPKEVRAFRKAESQGQFYNRIFRPRGGSEV